MNTKEKKAICEHPYDSVCSVSVYDDENSSVAAYWCSRCGAIKARDIDMDADRLPPFEEWELPAFLRVK
jgi:hypothetical protein